MLVLATWLTWFNLVRSWSWPKALKYPLTGTKLQEHTCPDSHNDKLCEARKLMYMQCAWNGWTFHLSQGKTTQIGQNTYPFVHAIAELTKGYIHESWAHALVTALMQRAGWQAWMKIAIIVPQLAGGNYKVCVIAAWMLSNKANKSHVQMVYSNCEVGSVSVKG